MVLLNRRTGVVLGGFYQSDAGEEEDGSEHTIHYKCFNLVFRAFGIHENKGGIDEPYYSQYSEYDAESPFYVHTKALGKLLQKDCQQAVTAYWYFW